MFPFFFLHSTHNGLELHWLNLVRTSLRSIVSLEFMLMDYLSFGCVKLKNKVLGAVKESAERNESAKLCNDKRRKS